MGVLSKILNSDSKPIDQEMKLLDPEEKPTLSDHPRICLIDLDDISVEKLNNLSFNIQSGTLGQKIKMSYQREHECFKCNLNYSLPPNLHEYDIVVVDLKYRESLNYDSKKYLSLIESRSNERYFETCYPKDIFNPIPFTSHLIEGDIQTILDHGGIIIVFSDSRENYQYTIKKIEFGGRSSSSELNYHNYDFLPLWLNIRSKFGKEIEIVAPLYFTELLKQHSSNFTYDVTFDPIMDTQTRATDKNFIPLLKNSHGEIVSFLYKIKSGIIIFFPQLEAKSEFLGNLFSNTLPLICPSLFPHYSHASWRSSEEYQLPGEQILTQRKNTLIRETTKQIQQIDEEITKNKEKYSCLHSILVETNTKLVDAVKIYLEWLGFSQVRISDLEKTRILEEDLQFEYDGKTILSEVKGIGRTSKDEECSQIDKIVLRRIRETGNAAIHGVYIVNHQKHLPPLDRQNPPFTREQITDAIDNSRGLITTWQLFNLYFSIKNGAITKEEARNAFLKTGIIEFAPHNLIPLGKPKNVLKNGEVILLILTTKIRKNGVLFINRGGRFYLVKICEIRCDDNIVEEVDSGDVGIKIDMIARSSDEIYYRDSV